MDGFSSYGILLMCIYYMMKTGQVPYLKLLNKDNNINNNKLNNNNIKDKNINNKYDIGINKFNFGYSIY
jgi:hypothetical protein